MARKPLLPSDKMTLEEYEKEDLSRMRNLVADYERVRTPGKVLIDSPERIQELIDEIKRDPRNYIHVPKFLRGNYAQYSTSEELDFFYSQLKRQIDTADMRNKLERMAFKPFSRITPAEMEAFNAYVILSELPQVDGPESIRPDVYFNVDDMIFRGHKAIRMLDKERASYGDNVPPEFEEKYYNKLADVVLKAPQIFTELPKQIVDTNRPNNSFYESLSQKSNELTLMAKNLETKKSSGEKITKEDHYKEELIGAVKEYGLNAERFAEEVLSKMELQKQANFRSQELEIPLEEQDDDYFKYSSLDEMGYFEQGGSAPASQEELDAYFSSLEEEEQNLPPVYEPIYEEDLYIPETFEWINEGLPSIDDNVNLLSMQTASGMDLNNSEDLDSFKDYVFHPANYDSIEIDEYDGDAKEGFAFGYDDKLQLLSDEWYELNAKDDLSNKDISRMLELESEMGTRVAKDQSLYMSVPSEITDPAKGNSPFFNSLIKKLDKTKGDIDPIIGSDVADYKQSNQKWRKYHSPEDFERNDDNAPKKPEEDRSER